MKTWRTCKTHGDEKPNVYGCADCVRELRIERDALKTSLRESQDDADAQRMLAENYMDAFASTPDQQLADGLEKYIEELKGQLVAAHLCIDDLKDEFTSARQFIIDELLNSKWPAERERAKAWLHAHPEPEGEGK